MLYQYIAYYYECNHVVLYLKGALESYKVQRRRWRRFKRLLLVFLFCVPLLRPSSPQERHPLFIPRLLSPVPPGTRGIRVLEMYCFPMPGSYIPNLHVYQIWPSRAGDVKRLVFWLGLYQPQSVFPQFRDTSGDPLCVCELWPRRPSK